MGTSVFERPFEVSTPEGLERLIEFMSKEPKERITYRGGYDTPDTKEGKEKLRRWLEGFEKAYKDKKMVK